MSKIFFTSDPHYNHKNIITYCNRPFASVSEMNESLINRWNSVVSHEDTTYVIGDFAFDKNPSKFLCRLNGTKVLIKGNHDKRPYREDGWDAIHDYLEITHKGKHIVMCHYSMRVWNKSHRGSWMLYGHSHGTLPDDPYSNSIDVGVDCHNYTPISFDDVERIMKKKKWKPVDHHGQ